MRAERQLAGLMTLERPGRKRPEASQFCILFVVQAAVTKTRLSSLNNRHLFLIPLEAGKFKIKVPPNLVPDEDPLLGLQMASFSLCLHIVQRALVSSSPY